MVSLPSPPRMRSASVVPSSLSSARVPLIMSGIAVPSPPQARRVGAAHQEDAAVETK